MFTPGTQSQGLGRPSSINSLMVRPPSVTPLRNSRMRAPAGGGLAGELGLNLGSDVNGDRHDALKTEDHLKINAAVRRLGRAAAPAAENAAQPVRLAEQPRTDHPNG